jgi:hypothetical protein
MTMNRFREHTSSLAIFALGFAGVVIFYMRMEDNDKTALNFITLLGTYISIYGLYLAYFQILSVKDIAKNTKIEIDEANKKIFKLLSVSDLSKSIKIVHEIQGYLRGEKNES